MFSFFYFARIKCYFFLKSTCNARFFSGIVCAVFSFLLKLHSKFNLTFQIKRYFKEKILLIIKNLSIMIQYSNVLKMANAMRFYHNKTVLVIFWMDRKWYNEQLIPFDDYQEWFNIHAPQLAVCASRTSGEPMQYTSISFDGKGKYIEKFLREYSHVICNVRFLYIR